MYAASTDSNVAEGGTCHNFTIKLPQFLNFDPNTGGHWSVALSEIILPKRKQVFSAQNVGLLNVECPQTGSSSIVNGGLVSILRRIPPQEAPVVFRKWIYVPLQNSSLNQLTIRLAFSQTAGEELGTTAQDYFDETSPTFITLVFKRAK